jgi:NADPH:quinone reductase-like Zn-dependent oxidoreductase
VTRVRTGDQVYFCDGGFGPTPGTYVELKVIDERYIAHKPRRLSFVEAAAAPLVTITAWEALRERARVEEDQFALVQAGAGGVGHMALQTARLAGARVATTVTPGAKAELASSLGAELCIDYRREDVGERLRAWTGMDGADVVHDTVGGKTFTACFSLVRPVRRSRLKRREPVGAGGDHSDAQPEPARLLRLDARAVSVRMAEASRAPDEDSRARQRSTSMPATCGLRSMRRFLSSRWQTRTGRSKPARSWERLFSQSKIELCVPRDARIPLEAPAGGFEQEGALNPSDSISLRSSIVL